MQQPRSILALVAAISPLLFWSICFTLLYGLATLACRVDAIGNRLGLVLLLAVLLLTLAPLAWIAMRGAGRGSPAFLHLLSRLLGGLAFLATLWLLVPLLLLRLC